jgi:ribonuclease/clavin/mitogillin
MLRPRELSRHVQLFPARTPTLPPATHTNSYALGTRDVLLIEPATPYDGEQRAWIEWARGLASAGRRLVAIVATHHHLDHIGGIDVLARELGLPVWGHAETTARVPEWPIAPTLAEGDRIVLEGPEPETWHVLFTPGHAPGHVCLFEPKGGELIIGDMAASVGTILIAPGDGDMRVYLEQLERLAGLGARVALPAHGEPIERPHELFRHYMAHRLMREKKALAAVVGAGTAGATVEELVPRVYDDTPPHVWPIAKLSLESHLMKLVDEGRVASRDARYSAVS